MVASATNGPRQPRSASRQAAAKIKQTAEIMASDEEQPEKLEIGKKRSAPF